MSDSSGRRRDGPGSTKADAADEREWRFGIDEVGEDAEPDPSEARAPLEPESVSAENAFFVLVGAAATLLLFWALATP